jgi:hypothetical protein
MQPTRTIEEGASGPREERVAENWCSRLNRKPLNKSVGLVLTTVAALLLLISGARVLAEEEPAARASLPPPLGDVPAKAGELRMPTGSPGPTSGHSQSDSTPPTVRLDRPILQPSQKKPRFTAAPHRGAPATARRGRSVRSADRSKAGQQDHRAIVSRTMQGRDRLPAGPRLGQLSPPKDDPEPRIENTPLPPMAPPRAPSLYYPDYFARSPAYGYAPSYPFAWAPPGPGVFR